MTQPLLWDSPDDPKMDIRFEAPRAPGSSSSDDAAAELEQSGKLQRERRRVLVWFAAQNQPRTRHECAEQLYPESGGLGSACGRVNDLIHAGWLAEVGRQGKRSTIAITASGRARLREAA